jgi:hypothetical protein
VSAVIPDTPRKYSNSAAESKSESPEVIRTPKKKAKANRSSSLPPNSALNSLLSSSVQCVPSPRSKLSPNAATPVCVEPEQLADRKTVLRSLCLSDVCPPPSVSVSLPLFLTSASTSQESQQIEVEIPKISLSTNSASVRLAEASGMNKKEKEEEELQDSQKTIAEEGDFEFENGRPKQ